MWNTTSLNNKKQSVVMDYLNNCFREPLLEYNFIYNIFHIRNC